MSFFEKIKKNLSEKPIIVKILYVISAISLIYALIGGEWIYFMSSLMILYITDFIYWLHAEE